MRAELVVQGSIRDVLFNDRNTKRAILNVRVLGLCNALYPIEAMVLYLASFRGVVVCYGTRDIVPTTTKYLVR